MNPLTVIGSARPSSGPRSQPGYPISRLQRTNWDGAEATSAASRKPTTTIPASAVEAAASWTPGRRRPSAPCVRSAVAIVPRRLIRRGKLGGCAVLGEDLREPDRAVVALAVLQQRDDRAADCHRGAVEGVHVRRPAPALGPEAHGEAARLVVGRVRAGGELAEALLTGQPRLDVVLLRRRRTEIVCSNVHHPVGHAEVLHDALLDREQPFVLGRRVLGPNEREQLDLVQLVHAKDAACVPPRGARLAAEAGREAGVADRQRGLLEYVAGVQ